MYPYHNVIKKRIKNGELERIEVLNDKDFAIVLVFSTKPFFRPIRHKSLYRYIGILEKYDIKINKKR